MCSEHCIKIALEVYTIAYYIQSIGLKIPPNAMRKSSVRRLVGEYQIGMNWEYELSLEHLEIFDEKRR